MIKELSYAEHFAQATVNVLETFMEKPSKVGEVKEIEGISQVGDVAVIIGLSGSREGRFLLEMSDSCALRMCVAMNFGEPFEELNSLARSTLCELANLIVGRAVTVLNDSGTKFSISPPTILQGSGMKVSGDPKSTIVPIFTQVGPININLCLNNK